MTIDPQGERAAFAWRSEAYAWFVVALLALSFALAMLDRMLLVLMVEPIKADLGLTDTQVSLLHGLAFTLFYVVFSLPLGRMADRLNRRTLVVGSVVGWSLATAAGAGAGSFVQLFAARLAVGVGEAGLSPAANSIIADYFPRSRVARPIAYYSLGGTGGAGLSLLLGGVLIQGLQDNPPPFLGGLAAWKAAFLVAGALGLVFALALLVVREPPRLETGRAAAIQGRPSLLPFLKSRAGFLAAHMVGCALVGAVVLAMHAWLPTVLVRRFSLSAGEVGRTYGLVVTLASVAGVLLAGQLVQILKGRGVRGAAQLVALVAAALAAPAAMVAALAPSPMICVALAGCALFLMSMPLALAPVALQLVAPNALRGQVYAIYVLVLSALGYVAAPTAVALLTDHVFGVSQVGCSIAAFASACTPVAGLLLWAAWRMAPHQAE